MSTRDRRDVNPTLLTEPPLWPGLAAGDTIEPP
jgi:hypothetical protein